MHDHARRFLDLATRAQALRFGAFTLKSGRSSPYFFNAGSFDSGAALATLAGCYADAVDAAGLDFDLLFGPAYKGIPLATALALEFARRGRDLPLAFDRKETKAHGEGGHLIGAPLAGRRVLVVDDVITAGTAIGHSLALIVQAGGIPAGVVIALDRQEVLGEPDSAAAASERLRADAGTGGLLRAEPAAGAVAATPRQSAAQAVALREGIPVVAIATLTDLLAFADENATLAAQREGLQAYRTRYGSVPAP